jgi:large repetitive protein
MMLRAFKRRALLAPAMLVAISVATAAMNSPVALASGGNGPVWGTQTTFPDSPLAEAFFTSATCPAAGTCLAAGDGVSGSTELPVAVAESGGTWGAPSLAAIAGVSSDQGGYTSISCLSASSCVGVGFNTDSSSVSTPLAGSIDLSGTSVTAGVATTVSLPSAPASDSPEQAGLASVSCAASSCTAVGSYEAIGGDEEPIVATPSGFGTWNAVIVQPPIAATRGANLNAISCPSAGACEAVGNYIDGSSDVESWAVQLSGSETPQTLTPPSGAVATTGGLPMTPTSLTAGGQQAMSGISCPTVGACTAIGSYPVSGGALEPMAIGISDGAPAAATALQPAGGETYLTAIWCSDAGNCAVVGDLIASGSPLPTFTPLTGYESSGAWSPLADLPGGAPTLTADIYAIGLGCSAVDSCLATGLETDYSTTVSPMVDFSAPPLSVTTSSLPAAVAGVPYSTTLQGAGGAGTASWSISGSLPAGLSLNAATGVISGTPTAPGSESFSVQLASAGPPPQTASINLSIGVTSKSVTAVPVITAGATKVTPNGVSLTIGCAGSGPCTGTAAVTAVEHLSGKRATAVTARAKKKTVKLTLAHGRYSLSAGRRGTVTLKLTGKAKTLLGKLHKISGKLTLTPTGAKKPAITRTVTFKSAAKKRR